MPELPNMSQIVTLAIEESLEAMRSSPRRREALPRAISAFATSFVEQIQEVGSQVMGSVGAPALLGHVRLPCGCSIPYTQRESLQIVGVRLHVFWLDEDIDEHGGVWVQPVAAPWELTESQHQAMQIVRSRLSIALREQQRQAWLAQRLEEH